MRRSWAFILVAIGIANGLPSKVDPNPYDFGYEHDAYGPHPLSVFKSAAELEVPKLDVLQSSKECESSLYTLLTPRGGATREPQTTILDGNGDLIWTSSWRGQQLYNLMVQEYRGEKYLTFWAGNDAVGGHGAGTIIMLDKSYVLFKEIKAANGLDADLHDFRITEAGTALITVYEIVQRDLSEAGKNHIGPVWDCLIQEIDLETGQAIFQWRALDHWRLSDGFRDIGDAGEGNNAYDFFHMNSIAKDERGNYLTSSRYMHSLTYINGKTGDVIWILGGKRNMFKDLSNGTATNFAYQHDARWSGNDTITLFDNGVDDVHRDIADTRGLKLKIDEKALTVSVVAEYFNPHKIHGVSQGSFQSLSNGNVLLGYGNSAAFTEFTSDGDVLCDTHFGPESRFGTAEVQSYRVYKYEWHGQPLTKPSSALRRNSSRHWNFYVSWNGATEVSKWILQGAPGPNATDHVWKEVNRTDRLSFESAFELRKSYPRYLRAVAVHSKGHMLGVSEPVDSEEVKEQIVYTYGFNFTDDEVWITEIAMAVACVFILGALLRMGWMAWVKRSAVYSRVPTAPN
ncbi:ASST-domain-containing protein [Hypoxylon trugodes]|uniref:ASST-domain-containing protein n=1 Tax=Hypoxylon trugodes TaxID=326681 RepID=UPI00218E46DE|nr:ASST-domain-containing protein [Hypoxylon trugodes]KAI1391911.1 ASST-domain-containing protein [Hypoxylon trugodes]